MGPMKSVSTMDVQNAPLPAQYEAAKAALAECTKIDECWDWADKAEAIASYARQADDASLENMAKRIRSRAIKRCGKLLEQFKSAKGRPSKKSVSDTDLLRHEAARNAGLTEEQTKTALAVARVPDDEFEAMVERETPATTTEVAQRGKSPKEPTPKGIAAQKARQIMAGINSLSRAILETEMPLSDMARVLLLKRCAEAIDQINVITSWLEDGIGPLESRLEEDGK